MSMVCKFCESEHVDDLRKIQSPHSEEKYTLYECRDCKQRFFRMDERENSRDILKKLYDGQAEKNKNIYGLEFTTSKYWKNEVKEITALHSGGGSIAFVILGVVLVTFYCIGQIG